MDLNKVYNSLDKILDEGLVIAKELLKDKIVQKNNKKCTENTEEVKTEN